jgi:AbrB family looped-hinge helix DNA binding protein
MPVVKIGRSRQVTIPKKLFDSLALEEGSYMEVERQGNKLILVPKVLLDRDKVKTELFKLVDRIRERNKALRPEEVEAQVAKVIEEIRAEEV